mmetsp:Transcript_21185/g.62691  ORF Transcript_21185/g.62691 Transcript_21185/m.62691 type:complete len:355 (+) Transcript_21185:365-1429(+)
MSSNPSRSLTASQIAFSPSSPNSLLKRMMRFSTALARSASAIAAAPSSPISLPSMFKEISTLLTERPAATTAADPGPSFLLDKSSDVTASRPLSCSGLSGIAPSSPKLSETSVRVVRTTSSNDSRTRLHALTHSSFSDVSADGADSIHATTVPTITLSSLTKSNSVKSTPLACSGSTMSIAAASPPPPCCIAAASTAARFTLSASLTAAWKRGSELYASASSSSGDSSRLSSAPPVSAHRSRPSRTRTSCAASSAVSPATPRRTSAAICAPMSVSSFLRLPATCSSVSEAMLMEKLLWTTSVLPSTLVERTCRPMSGGSSVSASCGYCESHEMSAPRSIMPITSSSTVDALPSA